MIRSGDKENHKKFMLMALLSSAMFLLCYLYYHYIVGSVPYPDHWTKTIYLIILIPHVILAALMTPFIFFIVWKAFTEDFEKHKKLARIVFPVWVYVSVTGVIIYLMLYQLTKLF